MFDCKIHNMQQYMKYIYTIIEKYSKICKINVKMQKLICNFTNVSKLIIGFQNRRFK